MRRFGRPARLVLGLLVLTAAMFVFVFPTRAYLSQRAELGEVRTDLSTLRDQSELLAEEAARLRDPAEIEAIAREQYSLVRPGERAFAVIPAPAGESSSPDGDEDTATQPAPSGSSNPITD